MNKTITFGIFTLCTIAGFHMTSLKFKLQNYWSSRDFTFINDVQEQLKTNIHANVRSEWVLGFVIHYTWISKLLRDAAFTWRPRELSSWLKKWLISGNLASWTVHVLEKVLFWCFRVPWKINSRFCRKTQWHMFLLVSGCHVGAHTIGHQHGVSIQISINLGKKSFHVSCIRKIAVTRILARVFAYLLSFISQILNFIYWMVLIFILTYFEWRDTENQQ